MASGPFADAGLGMFGKSEKIFTDKAMKPTGDGKKITDLLAFLMPAPTNPYALQGNMGVAPGASGQGIAPPAMPGGMGMNPYRRSGMGLSSGTGLQAGGMSQPAMPDASPSGAGLDINNMIDSFWGAS